MPDSPPRLTTGAKVLLGLLALVAAGLAATQAAGLPPRLPLWALAATSAGIALAGLLVYRWSRARLVKRGLDGLRDLTVSDEGIRLPAGTLSTRHVPWDQIGDIVAMPSARFGDGYVRDAIWIELVTGVHVESSIQCFTPRSRLESQPSRRRQFEQTAVLDPGLFDAVIRRLRHELRTRRLRADTRRPPRLRRH